MIAYERRVSGLLLADQRIVSIVRLPTTYGSLLWVELKKIVPKVFEGSLFFLSLSGYFALLGAEIVHSKLPLVAKKLHT